MILFRLLQGECSLMRNYGKRKGADIEAGKQGSRREEDGGVLSELLRKGKSGSS